ncbi:MAG: helix-turn-helix domain-containing protein [Pseudobdellovibrionaceae bacterium]
MPRTMVFIVSDDAETAEKAKTALAPYGVTINTYGPGQWKEGLENSFFRSQLAVGLPSLVTGNNPLENRGNVLPFPGVPSGNGGGVDSKVSTMNELESKAIENAILQFRGNLTEAAKALGIGRATLYRKVKQYQIDPSVARKKRAA